MENERDELYEANIEKAKALFEYEMTSVLLAVVEENKAGKERVRKYMEMEVAEPKLEYTAPELEPQEVSFEAPSEQIVPPAFEEPEISVKVEGLSEIAETHGFAAPELAADTALRESAAASLPTVADVGSFSAEALQNAAAADIPPAELSLSPLPEDMGPMEVSLEADIHIEAPSLDIPETAESFDLGIAESAAVTADIPLPPTDAKAGLAFRLPEAEVTPAEIEVAAAPELPTLTLPEAPKVTAPAIEGIKAAAPDASVFALPKVGKVTVSVDYVPAVPVSFETAAPIEERVDVPKHPDYPDIPDAPDISADISEILELVRAEL
ncbi:MAG: hypothetical protein IJ746_04690 [Ruminococcus sp.]|nr:hypothetical protein [Ruminococcus sp.]